MICAVCNQEHRRVARSGDRWLCAGCHAPIVRATIGADGVLTLTLSAKVETVTFTVGVRES